MVIPPWQHMPVVIQGVPGIWSFLFSSLLLLCHLNSDSRCRWFHFFLPQVYCSFNRSRQRSQTAPGAELYHLGKDSVHPLLYRHLLVSGTLLTWHGDDQDHQLSPAEITTFRKSGCEIKTQSSGRLHSEIWMDKILFDKIAVIVTPVW